MRSIEVPLADRSYPVLVGSKLIDDSELWTRLLDGVRPIIVSNDRVAPLYLEKLVNALPGDAQGQVLLPDGEAHKNVQNWVRIIDYLVNEQAGRDACLIALGGGVVGDITGFAAASYMRGIRFIQVPTTLLAQVDASVGGKTAVNHPMGKNLVGAFHQPSAVVVDIDSLQTLPQREYRAGLAEVVKYGAICDADFLDFLEANVESLLGLDPETLTYIVEASVRHKAAVVAADELESGLRAILNFGHSFAHAFESLTDYGEYLHGEAVAIGMVVAARLSEQRGLCSPGVANRLASMQAGMGLPVNVSAQLSTEDILNRMKLDKKNLAGQTRLVLLTGAGEAVVDANSARAEIAEAIDSCRSPQESNQ